MGKVRSESEWQKIFRDHRDSGLSQEAYCRKHGISKSSYWKWQRKLKKSAEKFIEIPNIETETTDPDTTGTVEVVFPSGVVLRMRP